MLVMMPWAGVITLEDIIEELIQDEIIDESDNFENNEHSVPVRLACSDPLRAIPPWMLSGGPCM